jgi:DNA anti-recombination protein RmuC
MSARQAARGTNEKLVRDLQALRDDVAKLTEGIPATLGDMRDETVKTIRERANGLKQTLDSSLSRLSDRGQQVTNTLNDMRETVVERVEEQVQTSPLLVL